MYQNEQFKETVRANVQWALKEDLGQGAEDITAQLIAADTQAEAVLISREAAILCGQPWANEVFRQLDRNLEITWLTFSAVSTR